MTGVYHAGARCAVSAPNIIEIRAKARRFRSDSRFFPPTVDNGSAPLGLIIIDYLQLARGLGCLDSRRLSASRFGQFFFMDCPDSSWRATGAKP
ncbi:MAG: hypothetical protein ACLP66_07105 [Polyangia bacterium]